MTDAFNEKSNTLNAKVAKWRKTWKHRRSCKDWKEHKQVFGHGFCKHFVEAKRRKFKKEVDELFEVINVDDLHISCRCDFCGGELEDTGTTVRCVVCRKSLHSCDKFKEEAKRYDEIRKKIREGVFLE